MEQIVISNIQDYIELTERYKGAYYFRGQANASWDVKPRLYRDNSILHSEHTDLNEGLADKDDFSISIIKKILELQHFGKGTRLCDITINPLISLYFVIEDKANLDKDGAVFVFDNTQFISLDSPPIKVLTFLAANDYQTVYELKSSTKSTMGIDIAEDEITKIITKNYIIDYNIELSYSNIRALLQGGTGIFFGFDVNKKGIIYRKGTTNLPFVHKKIIIPSKIKPEIIRYLDKYGIKKEILYDTTIETYNKLSYSIKVNSFTNKSEFIKIIADIILSDVVFEEVDINNIVSEVFQNYKNQYGTNVRIFLRIYYDEEDQRASNIIALVRPTDDFQNYQIRYFSDYHKRRMIYLNDEISSAEILARTEPIVSQCENGLSEIIKAHRDFSLRNIDRAVYKKTLTHIRAKLHKVIYFDLQDISHGSKQYDEYYNSSNQYCMSIIAIAEEQTYAIARNDTDQILNYFFEMKMTEYEKSRDIYKRSLSDIKIECSK